METAVDIFPGAVDLSTAVTRDHTFTMAKPYELKVTDPTKVGEGMSSHIVYQIIFNGIDDPFTNLKYNVTRRFSDFLGLHEKLINKHLSSGIIIPHPPDKHLLSTTKVKMSKDVTVENDFIERRRLALERFLCKLLDHQLLREDRNLREFLVHEGELPRSFNTQLLSGASAKKMFKNFGDVLGKITQKMDEPDEVSNDEYFDLKTDELDSWEKQLKRLHGAFSLLVSSSQELVTSKLAVSRTISQLSNVEMHSGLAQALGSLASTEDVVSHQQYLLAEAEVIYLVDCAHETLGIIQSCKEVLAERMRIFRVWRQTEGLLRAKQEQLSRLAVMEKNNQKKFMLEADIEVLVKRGAEENEQFDAISETIKGELDRINLDRFCTFSNSATGFLESILETHTKLLEVWESYLQRAKTIN